MKRVLLSASVVLLPFLPYAQEVSKKRYTEAEREEH